MANWVANTFYFSFAPYLFYGDAPFAQNKVDEGDRLVSLDWDTFSKLMPSRVSSYLKEEVR